MTEKLTKKVIYVDDQVPFLRSMEVSVRANCGEGIEFKGINYVVGDLESRKETARAMEEVDPSTVVILDSLEGDWVGLARMARGAGARVCLFTMTDTPTLRRLAESENVGFYTKLRVKGEMVAEMVGCR